MINNYCQIIMNYYKKVGGEMNKLVKTIVHQVRKLWRVHFPGILNTGRHNSLKDCIYCDNCTRILLF